MSDDPQTVERESLTRRSTLRGIGALLVGGTALGPATAAQADGQYRVTQGDETFAVEPLSGEVPVEQFYGYHLPKEFTGTGDTDGADGGYYGSTGTRNLQRESTTITFLYDGPNGLSLVVVHGKSGGDGGAVTWHLTVRPADAKWLVRDDAYWETETGDRASTNYDAWATSDASHRIDWTWSDGATDGGVLGHLNAESAVRIRPKYNESAALYGEHFSGEITDWQFLSGDAENPERVSLALDEPVEVVGPASDGIAQESSGVRSDGSDGETATDDATRDDTTEEDGETQNDGSAREGDDTQTTEDETESDETTEDETTEDEAATDETDPTERPDDDEEAEAGVGREGDENDDDDRESGDGGEERPGRGHRPEQAEEEQKGRGEGREKGRGKGHRRGRGRGHEMARGEGHERHRAGDGESDD